MLRRAIASLVSAALILVAPGLPAWAAAGKSVNAGPSAGTTTMMPLLPAVSIPNAGGVNVSAPNLGAELSVNLIDARVSGVAIGDLQKNAQGQTLKASNVSLQNQNSQLPDAQRGVSTLPQSAGRATGLPADALPAQLPSYKSGVTQPILPPVVVGVTPAQQGVVLPGAAQVVSEALKQNELPAGLNRVFDNSRARADEPAGTFGQQSAGQAPLNASAPQAAQSDVVPPAPPANGAGENGGGGPSGPKKTSLWVVLALTAAGGVGAYFALPLIIGWTAPLLPLAILGKLLLLKGSIIGLGALAGASISQRQTWSGFFGKTRENAKFVGTMTFRFWARFGQIFHTVLTGGKAEDAMKAELPGSVFKYPFGAWPFVVIGYVGVPIAAVLGVLYNVIATPIAGAWRGVKQILVEVFSREFIERIIRAVKNFFTRFIPGVVGLPIGALEGLVLPAFAGARALGTPMFERMLVTTFTDKTLPGIVAAGLLKFASFFLSLARGIVGIGAGILASPFYIPTMALRRSMTWGDYAPKTLAKLDGWRDQVEDDASLSLLSDYDFGSDSREISFGEGLTRALNMVFSTPYTALAATAFGWANYFRSWTRGADAPGRKDVIEPAAIMETPVRVPGLRGYLPAIKAKAEAAATMSWRFWRSAGLRGDAAVRGVAPEKTLSGTYLAYPAAAAGAVAAVFGYVGGGLYEAAVIPGAAAYRVVRRLALKIWPTLKKIARFIKKAVVKGVPFIAGFVLGTFKGLVLSGAYSTAFSVRPFGKIFFNDVELRGWAKYRYVAASVILWIPAGAVAVLNFAVGVVVGIPYALIEGAGLAVRWSKAHERGAKIFGEWSDYALESRMDDVLVLHKNLAPDLANRTAWGALVAGVNAALHGLTSIFTWVPAGYRAVIDSLKDAAVRADTGRYPERKRVDEQWGGTQDRTAPEAKPWVSPSYIWALAGAVLGAAAFAGAAWFFALPAVLGLGSVLGYGVLAGAGLLGSAVGAGLTQPSFWRELLPTISGRAADSARTAYGYWSNAGAAFAAAVLGTERKDQPASKLAWLHTAAGGVLAVPAALLGGAVGAVRVSAQAAGTGLWQVISEFLPSLARFFRLIGRIIRRVVPFTFGLGAGFVMGVVGAMLFGVLLLARPYFKHVVGADFQYSGLGGGLHNLGLKAVALVLGVIMGVFGLVVGLLVALPYAITLIPSTAFQLGGIGGNSQKFFDLWSKGTLRDEMRRINALTNKFEFPSEGARPLVDGWLRLANIVPATLAATIAGTVAGWVSYFRSMINAGKALKRGDSVPQEGFDDMDGVWRASRGGASAGRWLGAVGGVIGAFAGLGAWLGIALLSGGFLAFVGTVLGLWLFGWLVGAVIGGGLGIIAWLARQLEK